MLNVNHASGVTLTLCHRQDTQHCRYLLVYHMVLAFSYNGSGEQEACSWNALLLRNSRKKTASQGN